MLSGRVIRNGGRLQKHNGIGRLKIPPRFISLSTQGFQLAVRSTDCDLHDSYNRYVGNLFKAVCEKFEWRRFFFICVKTSRLLRCQWNKKIRIYKLDYDFRTGSCILNDFLRFTCIKHTDTKFALRTCCNMMTSWKTFSHYWTFVRVISGFPSQKVSNSELRISHRFC